jgi:hypothetical protein
VLQRAGKGDAAQLKDLVWDAKVGSVTFDLTEEEKAEQAKDDALPPERGPTETEETDSGSGSSGPRSGVGSESLARLPSPIGSPRLETDRSVAG